MILLMTVVPAYPYAAKNAQHCDEFKSYIRPREVHLLSFSGLLRSVHPIAQPTPSVPARQCKPERQENNPSQHTHGCPNVGHDSHDALSIRRSR